MSTNKSATNLVWLDLEMTGLNHDTDVIIEIATIATDKDLNILAEGPAIAIHQPESKLTSMDEWCIKTHTNSGLVRRVLESDITVEEAEQMTLDFIKQWIPESKTPLCGNSIGMDRRFLNKYMPRLEKYFHYRVIDTSTLKELARIWRPDLDKFEKSNHHLAMEDVRESIAEMKFYADKFIKKNN